jgi:hypothetical protein
MNRMQSAVLGMALLGVSSGCGLEEFIDERVRFFEIEPRMFEIDPQDGAAKTLPAYAMPRSIGTTAMVAGELVSVGGIDEKSRFHPDVQVFDPVTNSWRQGADWPQTRAASGAVIGEEFCFSPGVAGLDQLDELIIALDCYSPKKNSWRDLPALPSGKYTDAGWLYNADDGTLYVPVTPEEGTPVVYKLPSGASEWQSGAGYDCLSHSGTFINERAYLPRCLSGDDAKESAIVEYDPATNGWIRIDPPASISKRGQHQATLGSIMVFLETDEGGVTLYDAANNGWANFAVPEFANANITSQSSAVLDGLMYTVVPSRNIKNVVGGEGVFEVWRFEMNSMSFEKIKDNTASAWQIMDLHAHEGRLLAPAAIVEPVLSIN